MTDYGNGASGDFMPGDLAPQAQPHSHLSVCQCEHACHPSNVEQDDERLESFAEPGNPAHHHYGQSSSQDLTEVKTLYGTFLLCKHCLEDHPYPKEYLA